LIVWLGDSGKEVPAVASYHLYYLRNNAVVGSDSIDATDDDEAIRLAREHGEGQAVEVWNAHSRIRIVAPAKAAVETLSGA
jgi:hypothetical protein